MDYRFYDEEVNRFTDIVMEKCGYESGVRFYNAIKRNTKEAKKYADSMEDFVELWISWTEETRRISKLIESGKMRDSYIKCNNLKA